MAREQLKDVFKKIVNEGNEVVILVKEYGYRKLKDAYLGHAVYIGQGQYGHEFIDWPEWQDYKIDPDSVTSYRMKQPECVKIGEAK